MLGGISLYCRYILTMKITPPKRCFNEGSSGKSFAIYSRVLRMQMKFLVLLLCFVITKIDIPISLISARIDKNFNSSPKMRASIKPWLQHHALSHITIRFLPSRLPT